MTRIYNLELQKMKKDVDKHLEENKDEINKAIIRRGCNITIRIDKLEYHHYRVPKVLPPQGPTVQAAHIAVAKGLQGQHSGHRKVA